MSGEGTHTNGRATDSPRFGVRLPRGIVTYFNDEPLLTWEQADETRRRIEEVLGERGEVEEVYVL